MAHLAGPPLTARRLAAEAAARAAARFPDLPLAGPDFAVLPPREARLGLAIYRGLVQRWLTLEYLLNLYLRQPLRELEPGLQGVLLTGAAQLVALERLPVHAVVDESVELARAMVRPGAAGLVNAVLRRLGGLVERPVHGHPWTPAADRLPLDDGFAPLAAPVLPDPADREAHLAVATSHPRELVRGWLAAFGEAGAIGLAAHGVKTPPVIVAVEPGFDLGDAAPADGEERAWAPHALPGFVVWTGDRAALVAFLRARPARRVQDPASAAVVEAAAVRWEADATGGPSASSPGLILDYCAGWGTKTRQLAARYPNAEVIATDADGGRLSSLSASLAADTGAAVRRASVRVAGLSRVAEALAGRRADLLLLDVPCSNTGVLARRPEARYRYGPASLASLVRLQRRIVEEAAPALRPGGLLVYSTCSLDRQENGEQARWIAARLGAELLEEDQRLPAGHGRTYRDGGYHALLRK